ncbi:RidA family protein [bacterium LRH843]|nr:RidA family protein [bacterium LRH843]
MSIEKRLEELNIVLPDLPNNELPFELGVVSGNKVYLSGQVPMVNGEIKYIGTAGSTVSIEEAQEAAKICVLNLLSSLKEVVKDLNKVTRVVKVNGYVASEKEFTQQPTVINAASNLLNDIFGKGNGHARAAIGVASLPGGASVEIEMIVEMKE